MSTVREVFAGAGLVPNGCVPWGTPIPRSTPGVYVVATTDDPGDRAGFQVAPLDIAAVQQLLRVRPDACVDGIPATEESIAQRFSSMWVPGEPVVYIGLAGSSLAHRVQQFYATAIGARAPHAGGWPVKMLHLDQLWVHNSECSDPNTAEQAMSDAFTAGLTDEARAALIDPLAAVPFANLMVPAGRRKRHGLTGVKDSRVRPQKPPTPQPRHVAAPVVKASPSGTRLRTQIVTATDIAGGRIRVPSATKRLFPDQRAHVDVVLLGETVPGCRWDPRHGPTVNDPA
jgi:hypothetical protein